MRKERNVIYVGENDERMAVSSEKHRRIQDFIKPDGDTLNIKNYTIKIFNGDSKLIEEGVIADYELVHHTEGPWDEKPIWSITIKISDGQEKIYRVDQFETWESEPPRMKTNPLFKV